MYYLKLIGGIVGGLVSVFWLLHMILYLFVQPPASPFLNSFFSALQVGRHTQHTLSTSTRRRTCTSPCPFSPRHPSHRSIPLSRSSFLSSFLSLSVAFFSSSSLYLFLPLPPCSPSIRFLYLT